MQKIIIISLVLLLLFSAGLAFVMKDSYKLRKINKKNKKFPTQVLLSPTPTEYYVNIANPASANCVTQGGIVTIKKRGDGSEYGLCEFDDDMACEEWALMRGECPEGGIKTTGFDTEAQRYCAWLGGKTLAVENAACTLPDGTICNDDKLYNGSCTP